MTATVPPSATTLVSLSWSSPVITFSMPADLRAPVARCTSMSATATTSMPAIFRTWATNPRPICPAPTRPTRTGRPVVDWRSRRRSRYAISASPNALEVVPCAEMRGVVRAQGGPCAEGGQDQDEDDRNSIDVAGFEVGNVAGGEHGAGQQLLVRLVDVEHDVAEVVEVLRGEVADGVDPQLGAGEGHGVADGDGVSGQRLRRPVHDAHLGEGFGQRLAEQDEDAAGDHVAGLRADVGDGGAVVGHDSYISRLMPGVARPDAFRTRPLRRNGQAGRPTGRSWRPRR